MPCMSTSFDTTQKRGHAKNKGSWSAYENSDPENALEPAYTLTATALARDEARETMAFIEMRAKRFARKYRFDDHTRAEIAQETALDLLVQQKLLGLDSTRSHKLINTAIRAVASRHIDPNVRHEDLTARYILKSIVAADYRETNVEKTSAEIKALADDIRMNQFAPGARPGEFFYLENRAQSTDRPLLADGTMTFGDTLVHEDLEAPFSTDDSAMADLVDGLNMEVHTELEDGNGEFVERKTRAQVRAEAWNHFADASDAPRAYPGTLTKADGKKAVDAVTAYPGGVSKLCENWSLGESTDSDNAALFAPFGDLGIREQEQVVTQLESNPGYADELWNTAASIASRKAPAAG